MEGLERLLLVVGELGVVEPALGVILLGEGPQVRRAVDCVLVNLDGSL
jgi:hypothetical protein